MCSYVYLPFFPTRSRRYFEPHGGPPLRIIICHRSLKTFDKPSDTGVGGTRKHAERIRSTTEHKQKKKKKYPTGHPCLFPIMVFVLRCLPTILKRRFGVVLCVLGCKYYVGTKKKTSKIASISIHKR